MRSLTDYTEVSDSARLSADPKVSVVMIAYAQEDVLSEAVESVAAQRTSFPFEIILSEDCSPDRTRDVALTLQRKYPHLVRLVFTPHNKGMVGNLRFALSLVRAPYIAICEGDDVWLDPEKLQRQADALEANPHVDLAFSQGFKLHEDGRRELGFGRGDTARIVPLEELFESAAWIAPTASLLLRAKVTRDLPPWLHDAPFLDVFLIMAGSARGGAYYDPAPFVAYRIAHPASFTVRMSKLNLRGWIRYTLESKRLIELACDHYGIDRRVMRDRLQDLLLALGTSQFRSGQPVAGFRTLATMDRKFVFEKMLGRLGLRKRR